MEKEDLYALTELFTEWRSHQQCVDHNTGLANDYLRIATEAAADASSVLVKITELLGRIKQ